MQKQVVLRLFKSSALSISLTLISPIWPAHAAAALNCEQVFDVSTAEAETSSPERIKLQETFLGPSDLTKISALTADAKTKIIKPPYKQIANVHPWAAHAYRAYRQARLSSEKLTKEQRRYLEVFKPLPAKDDAPEVYHQQIKLPDDYAHSILAYAVTAHELEHRIQYMKMGSLGLDEDFIEYFMRLDVFVIEAEAMRAEWEFANALSPAAGDVLAKMALENTLSNSLRILSAARNLSLVDYLNLNYQYKRYDPTQSDRLVEAAYNELRERLSKTSETDLAGLIGEWKIPKTSLQRPLEYYRHYLSSALPNGFIVQLTPESENVVVLKITRETTP